MAITPTILSDRLVGEKNATNETIDGLTGLDRISYDGSSTAYSLKYSAGNFTIEDKTPPINPADSIGIDTLKNIEKILFLGDQTQVSLSSESIVNVETSTEVIVETVGDQTTTKVLTNGNQTKASVLKMPDGTGYINFWQGTFEVNTKNVDATTGDVTLTDTGQKVTNFYFRKYDQNGIALDLDKKILSDVTGPVKAAIQNIGQEKGNIILAWSEPDADKNGISVQIFKPDGTEKSVKFRANDTLTDDQSQPSIAVLSDGSFVVAWTSANQGDSLQHGGVAMGSPSNQAGIFSQHFDSSGNPLGWEMKVSESGGGDPAVIALDNQNLDTNASYLILHEALVSDTDKEMTITASFYDKNDTLINVDPLVNTRPESVDTQVADPKYNELASQQKLPTGAQLANGNIVVVWQAPYDAYPTNETHDAHDMRIIAKLFQPNGDTLTDQEILVNTTWQYDQINPSVTGLSGPNGGFVVVWQSMLQDGSYWGVYGQRFDNDGNKVGGEIQVNTKVSDSQQQPSVTSLADGGFVVSWEGQYQDGNQQGSFQAGNTASEIIQQRYDKDGNPLGMSVAGGNGNDTISIGGSGDIEIAGGLGNDTLTSSTGNDTLRGGDGDDTLDPGAGNNTVIGGDGADTLLLAGGFDNYDITGSNGRYLIIGKANTPGAGIHDNISSVETIQFGDGSAPYSLDGIQGGGSTGTTVYGDSAGKVFDHLFGTNGGDTLYGGNLKSPPSADILEGGNGNDLYIAQYGLYLTIFDTGGNDTLQISSTIDLSHPESNKKTKGLNYIENVQLLGKTNLNLTGSTGDNVLTGNNGANKISGGAGNDTLDGGLGKDKLTGGTGADIFVFDNAPNKNSADTIMDFNNTVDHDKIKLKTAQGYYEGLDTNGDGKLDNNGAQFLSGPGLKGALTDSSSFLIYDTNTGNLYYDAANNPTSVLIAKVGIYELDAKNNPTSVFHPAALTSADFLLF